MVAGGCYRDKTAVGRRAITGCQQRLRSRGGMLSRRSRVSMFHRVYDMPTPLRGEGMPPHAGYVP